MYTILYAEILRYRCDFLPEPFKLTELRFLHENYWATETRVWLNDSLGQGVFNVEEGLNSKRAVLASVSYERSASDDGSYLLTAEDSLKELGRLAVTLGYEPVYSLIQERSAPDASTYLGKGKAIELAQKVAELQASCVMIDGQLSPSQSRNLEEILGVEVLDRTEVILRIFAARARTAEGKLQVELAQKQHALSQLAGRGVQMSNPGGGIGTRGPGETKIEQDRRALRRRIAWLRREIERVREVRDEQRKLRRESGIPLVSLVGYTNAGKSTLFNALTGEDVFRDDMLFATLDPWTRRWKLPGGRVVLLCDTVGFIQGLPHELVAAFRATLEESIDADLILQVVDMSSSVWHQQSLVVNSVLRDLGVESRPSIVCLNKCDVAPKEAVEEAARFFHRSVAISALRKEGLDTLGNMVEECLAGNDVTSTLDVPYDRWDVVARIREAGTIIHEEHLERYARLTFSMPEARLAKIKKMIGEMKQE